MEANGVRVICHESWPAGWDRWETVAERYPDGTPFHLPVWQEAAWRTHAPGGRMRIFAARRNEESVSFLPMRLSHNGILYSIGAPVCDYLDPLICADGWRAILGQLPALCEGNVRRIELHNVRGHARCREILPGLADQLGFSYEETLITHSMKIDLPGTWEAFLDSLEGHQRKEIRRKVKKAQERGDARLSEVRDNADLPALLDRCLHLMESGTELKRDSVRRVLTPLLKSAGIQMIRSGRLVLRTLAIHGEIAAFLLEFATPAGRMLYNCGIDDQQLEWSPGIVAIAMSIREAISRRETTYDLLRGQEPYKYRMGARECPIYQLTLRKRTS